MKRSERKPSNSRYAGAGVAVCLVSFVAAGILQTHGHLRLGMVVGMTGFGMAWASCALAQMVTGYSWKNLAPGNLGPHKSENPRHFRITVGMDLAMAAVSLLLAIKQLFKP